MSALIDYKRKRYGEPQRKLKADEPETRILFCVGYGGYKWGHPKLGEIVAKDLARRDRDAVESEPSKHVTQTPNTEG